MFQCRYGWVPDRPDQRDYLYQAIKPVIRLPEKVDLRTYCSTVEQQGQLGVIQIRKFKGQKFGY